MYSESETLMTYMLNNSPVPGHLAEAAPSLERGICQFFGNPSNHIFLWQFECSQHMQVVAESLSTF